ncbi:MAG: mltB 2 [Gammaproteobacteria bacterium]|nr:mltB 2 [Gammaproteobacteria bacterium]
MKLPLRLLSIFLLACSFNSWVRAAPLAERADVQAFIQQMVSQYQFDERELTKLFNTVQLHTDVVARKSVPYNARPWYQYEKLFVNPERIEQGVKFWHTHHQVLTEVEKNYGVPASVIIAILGIETSYGRAPLNYRAIDSLATLAFNYPPRAPYFTKELREFLLLTREQGIDPLTIKSSYDGGLGLPQFMPSSYRAYGVEIDGNKRGDLMNSVPDSIGSIANYLKIHGWQPGGYIAIPSQATKIKEWPYRRVAPQHSLKELIQEGIQPIPSVKTTERANVLALAGEQGPEHWLIFNNFYAITRYNTSPMYALAVYKLSQQLTARYKQELLHEKF